MLPVSEEQTLTEALRAAGFGHRKPENPRHGGRVIFELATGKPVLLDDNGDPIAMSAADGWAWLEDHGAAIGLDDATPTAEDE